MAKNQFRCDCNVVNAHLVEQALSQMPDSDSIGRLSRFYKTIGDETRCKILISLMQAEMCVCDLANILSMTKSSVSHQLNNMKAAGIVKCRREGKEVYYSLDDAHVEEIFAVSLDHIRHKMEGKI